MPLKDNRLFITKIPVTRYCGIYKIYRIKMHNNSINTKKVVIEL